MTLTTPMRWFLELWRSSPTPQGDLNIPLDTVNNIQSGASYPRAQWKSNSQVQTLAQQSHGSSMPLTSDDREHMRTWPMKYAGYPVFTKYLASSREAVILRRFDQMHVRVLLKMQDDIVQKEEEISRIDDDHMTITTPNDIHYVNGSFRKDANKDGSGFSAAFARRSKLLDELKQDIRHYDQMILNYRSLSSDPEPSKHYIENVRTYLYSWGHSTEPGEENHGPILQQEAEYIYKDGDLLELVPETKAPLRRLIERSTWFMLSPWFKARPKGTHLYQDFRDEKAVKYQSDAKIEGFITTLSLFLGLGLLVGPLQLLNRLDNEKTKLNVICGLIAAFLIMMGAIMPARPWETLGATAAYSAVLMVFMQIQSSNLNGSGGASTS